MHLSVIVVNYNVKEFLSHLLDSLRVAAAGIKHEIIIVDNASEDGSVELLKANFPEVRLVASSENLGFARANNLALQEAKGEYLLFINPDTIVQRDTLTKMLDFMRGHPDAGLAGCKILNADGTLQAACRRGFPGPWTSFCKVTGLSSLFPKNRVFAKYNLTYLDENATYEVDAISGAFIMMSRKAYALIGGFDDQFFMYGEDLDLCYRVQKAGLKVYYVHDTSITHYKGESTRRSNLDETKVFYDAMRIFVRKHFSSSTLIELVLITAIYIRQFAAFLERWGLVVFTSAMDIVSFNLALFLSESLYGSIRRWRGFPDEALLAVYTVPALIYYAGGLILGVYRRDRIVIIRTVSALAASFVILSSALYFFKDFAYSRAVLLMTFVAAGAFFIFWRAIGKVLFKIGNVNTGSISQRAIIVGTGNTARELARNLRERKFHHLQVIGFIDSSRKSTGVLLDGIEVIGSTEMLGKIVRDRNIREVIYCTEDFSFSRILSISAAVRGENINEWIAGKDLAFLIGGQQISFIDNIALVDMAFNLSKPYYRIIKRLFDIKGSVLLMLFLAPLFAGSQRVRNNPEARRIIALLPSVFRGTLSLVGGRELGGEGRTAYKAGVTGLWFTEKEKAENMEKLDIFYAKNQNIWMDVEILSKTLLTIFVGR